MTSHTSPLLAAIMLCGLAAGCASTPSVPKYAAQTAEPARLRIALAKGTVPFSGVGDGMTAFVHTDESCTAPQALGGVYNLDSGPEEHDASRRGHRFAGDLGMPLAEYEKLEVKEMLVDAGTEQQIALQFGVLLAGALGPFTRCNIALDQAFEPGKDYEIVGRFDSTTACSAVVNELTNGPNGPERRVIATVTDESHPLPEGCFVRY